MGWFSSIWDKFKNILKKLWKELRPILAIAVIVVLVMAPVIGPMVASWTAGTFLAGAGTALATLGAAGWPYAVGAGLGAGYLIDPETTTQAVTDVAEGVGEVVGVVAGALGSGVGSFVSATGIGSFLMWGAAAFVGYKLLTKDSKNGGGTLLITDSGGGNNVT